MKNLIYSLVMVFLASGLQAQFDRSMPKPGPAPKVNLGKPQTFELKNGLKVMVVENHKLPRVTMSLSMDNPPFVEGNKKGIDGITGGLIGNGTSKISKDAFQEEIDFMGANIFFHSSGASANSLSKYFPRVLELMAKGATDPLFTQDDFDKELARTIDGLKTEEKNVQSNARRVENALVFGLNHPNGEFVTEDKLKALTLTDVKNHYKTYFVPNNAYLVVIGDVKYADVKKMVEKEFGSWKKGNLPVSKYDTPKNVAKTEIDFVDMPNAVQSEIAILSSVNLKMTDKDYFAAIVANQIFGGDFNSYLNMNLREANGWTYGARSSIGGSKYTSKFRAGASVRNEVTDSAVVESMKELNKVRTQRVDADMLATVKAGLIGNFVMDAEKPNFVAGQAMRIQTQNLPADFYENYIKNIEAVTIEDVMAAAKKYFSYDNARILVVGKAAEVLPGLEKLGYKINYYDRFGNPTTKPEQKQADANVTVQSIFDQFIAAVGGENTKKVNSLLLVYETETQGMKLTMKEITTTKNQKLSVLNAMGMDLQKSAFNGKTGYTSAQGMKNEMGEEEVAAMKYGALPFPELTMAQKEGLKVGSVEDFNGTECNTVIDGDIKYFYDVKSGLKLGTIIVLEAQGQKIEQILSYEEYKEVSGVKVPSKFSLSVMGQEMAFDLIDAKVNEGVSDADFQ